MFKRFDAFVERCQELLYISRTSMQFERLLMVVVGGQMGSVLSNDVDNVSNQFIKAFTKICELSYDVLDVSMVQFETDVLAFSSSVRALETRITKVWAGRRSAQAQHPRRQP